MKVAVIGGGAMGSAAAWRLTARGADVTCFDRHSPPHTLGSTHGESRIIRTAYFEGEWYVPLLHEAFRLWRELEATTRTDLLTVTGALMIGVPSSEAVSGALESARVHDLDVDFMDADVVRERYPGHVLHDDDVGVLDRQAGFLRPEAAVEAMLSLVPDIKRNTAVTPQELLERFDAVVVAAGPWTPEMIDWIPLNVERQVHVWFALEPGAAWFTPDRFPAFYRQSREFRDAYGLPTLDGISIKVGHHHYGPFTDPAHIQRDVTEEDIAPLRRLVTTQLHGVTGRVVRTLTCMYTNTPDGHFAIGLDPNDPRITVISACSGHGFKFAPVIGDIAADLVLERKTSRDISHFSFTRFASGGLAHTR